MTLLQALSGGFELSADAKRAANVQKILTRDINNKFIQVGAVYLKPASKHPIDEKWASVVKGQTDLQQWVDDPNQQPLNVGFSLQFGWMDIDIDSDDIEYNRCILAAMDFLQIDTRFRFGRMSVGYPTHVMIQLNEDDSSNFEKLRVFEPKQIRVNGKAHHTQLRSFAVGEDKTATKHAKQTVMPGSVYALKSDANKPDLSVWYSGFKIAEKVTDITRTTPRFCSFTEIVRAVAFGTVLYLLKDHWVEGNRQAMAVKFTGWLARIVKDSQAINEHEVVSREVFCPIDTDGWAEKLVHLIASYTQDDEPHMRVRAYYDATEKLSRNPDAKVPGWTSLMQSIGADAVQALRTVITPGADVSNLTKMAERYVYDETDNQYIDRERHPYHSGFTHDGAELERRHKGDVVFINGKPKEAFRIFESSNIRKRVDVRDMYPDVEPGAIVRVNSLGNIVPDESEEDASTVFNTWQGWPIKPIDVVDPVVMADALEHLDTLFGYLTSGNAEQALWLKQWIAWTRQYPGVKQQIAPVIIGGQGIGKSFFGNTFLKAIFGSRLWGTASSKIVDNDFNIGPFKGKMTMFIDEAKFTGETSTEEIKKLIRNTDIGGVEKFQEGREYRIFARLVFASNLFNINISQKNVQDRALFYIKATTKEHRGMEEREFLNWTETLKPWFTQFAERLADPAFVRHLVHYFVHLPVNKSEVESIKYSSGNDAEIINVNMSWVRQTAKHMIEMGHLAAPDMAFEMPFPKERITVAVREAAEHLGFRSINVNAVVNELLGFGMTETITTGNNNMRMMRFTHKWGDVVKAYEGMTGATLETYRLLDSSDYGLNTADGSERLIRRTNRASIGGKF